MTSLQSRNEPAAMNQNRRKALTIVTLLAVALLTIGGAVAQRMEQRAHADRFSMGGSHLPVIVD